MSDERVCLTLIAARSLRDELFDYLSEQRDLVPGFTASDVAGHGPDVRLQTSAEQVKGRADEIMVRTILQAQEATAPGAAQDGIRGIENGLLDHAGIGIWRDRYPQLMSQLYVSYSRQLQPAIIGLLWPGAVQAEHSTGPALQRRAICGSHCRRWKRKSSRKVTRSREAG